MSDTLAVAAVTQTLVNLLDTWLRRDAELADTRVTAMPPDKARDGVTANQLNVFLYQTSINAAWRNMDMPRQVKQNETGAPMLPLNLHYLITAYGRENADVLGHRVLGRAMSLLHDRPLLGAAEIQTALQESNLSAQVERIRITQQPLTVDEMSKLWTTFQSQYRISVAYEVAVVLIESSRVAHAPLPVLTRGPNDQGIRSVSGVVPPFPMIEGIAIPGSRPGAALGDTLTLTGHDLAGDVVTVILDNTRLDAPKRVAPEPGATSTQIAARIPNDQQAQQSWPPGVYTVAVEVTTNGPPKRVVTSGTLAMSLVPVLGGVPVNAAIAGGRANVNVTCTPEVLPVQRVSLLLGDREIHSEPRAAQTNALSFVVEDADAGDYFLRVRVDGVDSQLIDYTVAPPVFDQTQRAVLA